MISTSVLTVLIVSLVMTMLFNISKRNPKEDKEGNIILQLPKFYWILGVGALLMGFFLLITAIFYISSDDRNIVLTMSLSAILLGSLLFAKGYISKIKINENSILEITILGKEKEIKWNEIESISFGKVSMELKIKSRSKCIKAHIHLIGFPQFVSKIEEKTGKTKVEIGVLF